MTFFSKKRCLLASLILSVFILISILFSVFVQQSNVKRIVGYFPSWASYREGRSLSTTATTKLTHLIYAFCQLGDDGHILADDSFSALQQNQTAADGTLLAGNFNAFRGMKVENPDLKIMLSVGGWNLSKNFSDIAADVVKREKFVLSAMEQLDKYGFDGYEMDWRYPVLGGSGDNSYRKDDLINYQKLIAELRKACNSREEGCELSMTVPSMPFVRAGWDFKEFSQYVDFFTVLTSDFAGGWSERTSHKSPLYSSNSHPQISIANIVRELKSVGLPENKLVLYVSADGTAWKGVTGGNAGLYETHGGMAYGNWDNRFTGATGKVAYRDIVKRVGSGDYQQNWDEDILAHTLYRADKNEFISYESPRSLQEKLFFADQEQLSGIALWELTSDVDAGSGLLDVIYLHYHHVGAYWLKFKRWLYAYWIVVVSMVLGSALGGLLLQYIQRRRAANEWLKNRDFIDSIAQLSQNMNQVAYLAMTPPITLIPKLTSVESNTLEHVADQSVAVIQQLTPLAEATQPALKTDSQAQALLNLERFTVSLTGVYSVDAMLNVMFEFLSEDDRVSAVQLHSDGDSIREYGEVYLPVVDTEEPAGSFSLGSSRNMALLAHENFGSYKLRLQFSEQLTDQEEVYFRGLCNQVLFACRQIKTLVQQPQLLADICAIAQRKDKLLFVKGEKGYSGVHATDLQSPQYLYLRLRVLLQYFPELLLQVHRSYLVNPEAVTGIVRKKSTYHLCVGKELVPISRSYLSQLKMTYPHWFETLTEAA